MADSQTTTVLDQGIFLIHRNKGKEHFQKAQLPEAERELEAASRIRPDDDQVLNLLGMVYFRQNKFEPAKAIYMRLIEKNPDVYNLHSNIGLIYLKQNQFRLAEKHFVECARIEPGNSKPHMYLGLIYEKQLNYMQALDAYRLAKNDKMVKQMELLIQRYAERGEPLPSPLTEAAEPQVVHATMPAQVAAAAAEAPAAVLPAPAHLPPAAPPLPEAPPPGEGTLRLPSVLPEYMKETDFFNPRKHAETEAQLESALDKALPDEVTKESPVLRARVEPLSVTPGRDLASDTSSASTLVLEPGTGPVVPLAASRAEALNLAVLTQPSVGHLKNAGDEFRITGKSYLEIDFKAGLGASMPRLIGGWGRLDPDSFAGIEGILAYRDGGHAVLYEDQFRIHLLRLTGESFFVKPGYVMALQPTLKARWEESSMFRILKIEGDGIVALAISTSPIIMEATAEAPLIVDSGYLAAVSSHDPIELKPAERPGFLEIRARGSALLFPATKM